MKKQVKYIIVSIIFVCSAFVSLLIPNIDVFSQKNTVYLPENNPTVVIEQKEVHMTKEEQFIEVKVDLTTNSGIISMLLELDYDRSSLSLQKVKRGNLSLLNFTTSNSETPAGYDIFPLRLFWDGVTPDYSTGSLVTLTFKVLQSANDTIYPITMKCDPKNTRVAYGIPTLINVINGSIELKKYTALFVNYDNSLLSEKKYKVGEMPTFDGVYPPVRQDEGEYTFVFEGWLPTVEPIIGDVVFVAQYRRELIICRDNFWQTPLTANDTYYGNKLQINYQTAFGNENVVLMYSDDGVSWVSDVPTTIGHYFVKASLELSYYYTALESVSEFEILRATHDLSNVVFEDIEKVFDGEISELKLTNVPNGLSVSYTTPNWLRNVGTLAVTATFDGDFINYYPVEPITKTITITRSTLKFVADYKNSTHGTLFKLTYQTFGNNYDNVVPILTKEEGTSVGEYKIYIDIPDTIEAKNYDYELVEGTYKISPNDDNVFVPQEDEEGEIPPELSQEILAKNTVYGEDLKITAKPVSGEVTYVYSTTKDGEFTPEAPVNVGNYYVKAVVDGTEEYAGIVSEAVEFNIVPKLIELEEEIFVESNKIDNKFEHNSSSNSFKTPYTGESHLVEINPELIPSGVVVKYTYKLLTQQRKGRNAVDEGPNGIDVQTFEVLAEFFCDSNHKLPYETRVTTIEIVKAYNSWVQYVQGLPGIKYGDEINPTAKARFGESEFLYYDTNRNLIAKPQEVGSYYYSAKVTETSNFFGLNSELVLFKISKEKFSLPTISYENNRLTINPITQAANGKPIECDVIYKINGEILTDLTFVATSSSRAMKIEVIPYGVNAEKYEGVELFSRAVYSVTFTDIRGEAPPTQFAFFGCLVNEPAPPTDADLAFSHWSKGDGKAWDFSKQLVLSAETLSATWIGTNYVLTYYVKDKSGVYQQYAQAKYIYNQKIIFPTPPSNPVDFKFVGWYYDKEFNKPFIDETMPAINISVYAKFALAYGIGDVNRDGFVNEDDIVAYERYLVGQPSVIFFEVADLSGDNRVDILDLNLLRCAVKGSNYWTVEMNSEINAEYARYKYGIGIGDVNGDGEINETDVEILKGYILNGKNLIEVKASDVNGDGQITVDDLVIINEAISSKNGYSILKGVNVVGEEIHYFGEYGLGDVNGDKLVNEDDYILFEQYMLGTNSDILKKSADISLDGKVDMLDLSILRNALNGTKGWKIISTPIGQEVAYDNYIVFGDVNGDGAVNSTDIIVLERHILTNSNGIVYLASDLNRDGKVDIMDLVILKMKLNDKQRGLR